MIKLKFKIMDEHPKWIYIVIFIAVLAVIFGYFYWKNFQKRASEQAAAPEKASSPAVSGTLPSINNPASALEKVPEINPVEKANPFKDVYKNPFE